MTRKHFQMIADILCDTQASAEDIKVWANKLALTNPRFDCDRFISRAMGKMG